VNEAIPFVSGSVFRAYADYLRSLGLLEEVKKRLSPEALALIERPPFALRWIESRLSDEMAIALYDLRGRAAVQAMGRAHATGPLSTLVRPLIGTTVKIFGGTPAAVYANCDSVCSILVKNVEFKWAAAGPRGGTLTIRHGVPLHDAAYANWEGVLQTGFGYAGHPEGTVARARLLDDGRAAEIDISW
jgi:hypothetical protein